MAGEIEILQELGLSANEAKLYLLMIQNGSMKANGLAAKSGLQRRTVYDTVAQLEKKGMAGRSQVSGVAFFSPSPPSSLLSFVDEKRDSIEKLLPTLSRAYEAEGKASVSVVYGTQGIKTMLEDILELRADYCVYYGQFQIFDYLPKFYPIFNEKRVKLGIKARHLSLDSLISRKRAKLVPLSETKFMDPSQPSIGVWWVYADRVVLFVLGKEPVMIFIKNAELAHTFQNTFNGMFSSNARVYRGLEGIRSVLEQTLEYKELLFIGGEGQVPTRLPEYIEKSYTPRALKRGVKWYNLGHKAILKSPATKQPYHTIRVLPEEWAQNPTVIWIFGNCVGNVAWRKEPVLFLIEDAHIAQAYRNYFWLLWKMAEKK